MSAEDCFSEAIALDTTSPESWGYLTLINLKLKRVSEAEICYSIALKVQDISIFLILLP